MIRPESILENWSARIQRMNGFRCSRWDLLGLLLILLGTSFWSTPAHAQTLLIKLVNGRSGRPISHGFVNVWVGNAQKAAMPITTDQEGIARLRLTENDSEIDVQNRRGVGVVNPVVKYSDSLRVNAGYVSCQPNKPDYSWLWIQSFSTPDVLRSGIVTANACGKAKASPQPGELIMFVRPLTFWEKLKQ